MADLTVSSPVDSFLQSANAAAMRAALGLGSAAVLPAESSPGVAHIRSDGNDTTGDGSPGKPFLTAQKAFDVGGFTAWRLGAGNFSVTLTGTLIMAIFGEGEGVSNLTINADGAAGANGSTGATGAPDTVGDVGGAGTSGGAGFSMEIRSDQTVSMTISGNGGVGGAGGTGGTGGDASVTDSNGATGGAAGPAGTNGGNGSIVTLTNCIASVTANGGNGGAGGLGGSGGAGDGTGNQGDGGAGSNGGSGGDAGTVTFLQTRGSIAANAGTGGVLGSGGAGTTPGADGSAGSDGSGAAPLVTASNVSSLSSTTGPTVVGSIIANVFTAS